MRNESDFYDQFVHNLSFVSTTSLNSTAYLDWQVTGLFYSAVHLMNFHLKAKAGLDCRNHGQREDYLSPFTSVGSGSSIKLSSSLFTCYSTLRDYSEAARYMKTHTSAGLELPQTIKPKILKKTLYYLDQLIDFAIREHSKSLAPLPINCPALQTLTPSLKYFYHQQSVPIPAPTIADIST